MMITSLCVLLVLIVAPKGSFAAPGKPNIIYILTDDQDIKLNSLHAQPKVRSLLIEQGLMFDNAYVTTPVCCPSRSSILTGKYVHNHHTYENNVHAGCNSQSWRDRNEQKTMGAYMSKAGYKTGFFGKYLNNYALANSGVTVKHIPTGWDRWYTLVGNSKFYHYSVSNQGVEEKHGSNYTQDYFTDRICDQAVKFIKDSSGDAPFFMYIATPAPHRPATPAPQYANYFSDEVAPRTPSYGFAAPDKHWIITNGTPPLTTDTTKAVDDLYRDRIRTLVSVDDLVEAVINALKKTGVYDNTYIFYNSDHGYHLGENNQQGEKRQPYDENIRVPFIAVGPGIPKNQKTSALALNIDMAPTFIDLAGANVPEDMDGISLKSELLEHKSEPKGYNFMIEYYGENTGSFGFIHDCHNNTWLAIRNCDADGENDIMYARFYTNDSFPVDSSQIYFHEYYTFKTDPWQKLNIAATKDMPSDVQKKLEESLDTWYQCSGESCHNLRNTKLF
jgi:N-acetylglucosamine-6-sulfatase